MVDNIYVNVKGQFYSSTYPFSVNDSLVPVVSSSFRAYLLGSNPKPNATQRKIYLDDYLPYLGDMKNGLVSVTAAVRAALLELRTYGGELIVSPGDYLLTGSLPYYPYVTVTGAPGATRFFSTSQWDPLVPGYSGTKYAYFFSYNEDTGQSGVYVVPEDGDILFQGLTLDYSEQTYATPGGGKHAIRCFGMKNVVIQNCNFEAGENATALLNCLGTRVVNNTAEDQTNCFWDHWHKPANALVMGNYASTAGNSNQAINFNPESAGSAYGTGVIADGLLVMNNYVEGSSTDTLPWQIEPLHLGNTVQNVSIIGNRLVNSYLVVRGNFLNGRIADNEISTTNWPTASITSYAWDASNRPNNVVIEDNVVNTTTIANPFGAIRFEGDNGFVRNNQVFNGGATAGIYTTVAGTLVSGNTVSNGIITTPGFVSGRQNEILANGLYRGWRTPGNGNARFVQQTDGNFIFFGTDASFADRGIFTIFMDQDSSDLFFGANLRPDQGIGLVPTSVAANGVNIGSATTLTSWSRITSATAAVNDAIKCGNKTNALFVIFNDTLSILKLFPANTGAATMDGGAIGASVAMAAGERRIVWQATGTQYVTLARFP